MPMAIKPGWAIICNEERFSGKSQDNYQVLQDHVTN